MPERPGKRLKAEVLSVGTELLLGQIVDTNAAYLAGRLARLGIDCLHMQTVGDNLGRAVETFRLAITRSDLVIATGGLGPTEDDLTREAIAAALDETPSVEPSLERELREWFAGRGMVMPDRNRKQAWLIPSAHALANPLGTAPGWDVRRDGKRIVAMPGVPREMTVMWEGLVEPTLAGDGVLRLRTLKLLGIGESAVEERLGELVRSTSPTVATYAKSDGVHVRIADKAAASADADARVAAMEREIRARVGEFVWGVDEDTLATVIARSLVARRWRLGLAEALSGGEIARLLTEGPDAERWLAGGIVRVGADFARLTADGHDLGAEVVLMTPHGDEQSELVVTTPSGERRSVVRFRTASEGRRRAALGGLDLLRRTLGE